MLYKYAITYKLYATIYRLHDTEQVYETGLTEMFLCDAEDREHAIYQLRDEYPNAKVLRVYKEDKGD